MSKHSTHDSSGTDEFTYASSLRASIGGNATAYGFSVMITASFAVLSTILGSPAVHQVFMFAAGAVFGFVSLEVAATSGLRRRLEEERPDVLSYGAAFSLVSVTTGVGMAAVTAEVLHTGIAWPLAPAAATASYLLVVAAETLLGREEAEGD